MGMCIYNVILRLLSLDSKNYLTSPSFSTHPNKLEDTAEGGGGGYGGAYGGGGYGGGGYGGGLRPSAEAYYAVLAHFWHFLVSSSNLGNF